jgi:hypothetical protein
MNQNIWHAEKYVPLLMTYGFTLHIIRVALYVRDGTEALHASQPSEVDGMVETSVYSCCSRHR